MAVFLCFVAILVLSEVMRARASREVQGIVAQLTPGLPFSAVTNRLGEAVQTFTTEEEIRVFGTLQEPGIITNSILHAFGHVGPPYRWILVYTDRQSQKVLYAGCKDL